MISKENAVRVQNLSVIRGSLILLDDVSLDVASGEFAAILGPNGAGKTTLLRCILGLLKPDSGYVEIFGKRQFAASSNICNIGYVPQLMKIDLGFPVSVFETVLMGTYSTIGLAKRAGDAEKQNALKALEKVGIADLKDRSIGRLSGGQRQRVFIARALACNPKLLILDEPTTGVDSSTSDSLYELLLQLKKEGVTIILVSHDVGVIARYTDVVACLNKSLVAHGNPADVLSSEPLKQMYGCDVAYLHHCGVPHIVVEDHNV